MADRPVPVRFAARSLGIALRSWGIAHMSKSVPVDDLYGHRVRHLLQLLRGRTPEELMIGGLLFAPAFTPEMREALRLLHLERGTGEASSATVPAPADVPESPLQPLPGESGVRRPAQPDARADASV